MEKKLISIITKILIKASTAVLLLTLFLNVSTLWSTGEINGGKAVKSGYFCAIIDSGSMMPAISVNDLLLIKGGDAYQADDIITYVSPRGALVTHRVKEVSDKGYIAQGDANNIPDEEISAQRVLGKVIFVIPGAGGIIDGIISPAGAGLSVCIVLLVWLIRRIRGDQNEDEPNKEQNIRDDVLEY